MASDIKKVIHFSGHVHFGADCEEGHSSSIVLQKVDEENVNAHVGFLQVANIFSSVKGNREVTCIFV